MLRAGDGVCEGVAIGGDAYPGSRFVDHLLRYENNEDCKILVLLGEVGGADEYDVCEAITSGRITKPLIAWCIGTCASAFSFEVQFGHAGACACNSIWTRRSRQWTSTTSKTRTLRASWSSSAIVGGRLSEV